MGHARKERVGLFGTDQRITSGPAARRPHSKAEYMTAPERFADSQIPLAPRAPSIHDPYERIVHRSSKVHRARILPEKATAPSISSAESFGNIQTCYERLWQSPSGNAKQDQRNNQNGVDDRRFKQLLIRV